VIDNSPAPRAILERYDTTVVAPSERWDYWRTWYSEAVVTPMNLERVEATPAAFAASVEVLEVGDVALTEIRLGPAYGEWDFDGMDEPGLLRLCLFRNAPRLTAHWHGRDVAVGEGAALLHGRSGGSFEARGGFHSLHVNVPRRLLPISDAEIDRVTAEQNHGREPVFKAVVRPMLIGAFGGLRGLSAASGASAAQLSATWVSVASMLVLALRRKSTDGVETELARAAIARRYIRQNLASPGLDPESVARAMFVSRRSLYGIFAGESGVATVIRKERLDAAAARLRDPSYAAYGVAQVGATVGLTDIAHFSRAFKAEFGMSPRAWRAQQPED
jgi:AraC-like DNA-binding protein